MRLFNAQHASTFALVLSTALGDTIVTLDTALSNCPPLGPVLPSPRKPSRDPTVQAIISGLKWLESAAAGILQDATALSISIASIYEDTPLLNLAYTPPSRNTSGTSVVDADTIFRIGSVSKVFTVMGLLLLGDKVNLADPVIKYIPELGKLKNQQEVQNAVTTTNWEEITLDSLASQLSGLGSGVGIDLASVPSLDPEEFGLPNIGDDEYVDCGASGSMRPCTWDDFWGNYGKRAPTYGPYTTPAYSNAAYEILSLVIERVSSQTYENYIQEKILVPLNMTQTYLAKPANDKEGFISRQPNNWWSTDLGISLASGGYYSSSNDLVKFGKGILSHQLLSETATRAWLKPRTHTASLGISVGSPWEIARSNNLTVDGRVIDLYSKNGAVGDYSSLFVLIPDYGLVVSFLTAGELSGVSVEFFIANLILPSLVRGLEAAGKAEAQNLYAGTYADPSTNSSITVEVDNEAGLNVTNWVMNGKDILAAWPKLSTAGGSPGGPTYLAVRLLPAQLEGDNQEAWRAVFVTTAPADVPQLNQLFILQLACQSWLSIDPIKYGLRGFNEFTFELDNCTRKAKSLSPTAFRQTLDRGE